MNKTFTIFHNPRCSKSRAALEILIKNKIQPNIFLYLKKKLSKQNSISFLFAKKYIYIYYPIVWIVLLLYVFTR